MGARMRAFDWSLTPLGPAAEWPQSLKTAVRIVLTSRQAMFVWWGKDLINIYNDPYKAIVGGKHPEALGQPASQVWREIWDQVGPRVESAIRNDEGTYDEALLLIMERNGYPEETYYTFSYSPVPNDGGGIGGIICANTDDTQKIIGERQLALLRDLAAATADARTFDDACSRSAGCLTGNPFDLPFAMIYLTDPGRERLFLAGTSGVEPGHPAVPDSVPFGEDRIWPFAEVLRSHSLRHISLPDDLAATLPRGPWEYPPRQAVAVPIAPSGQTGRAGVLIVGLNPVRLFDDNYRGFIDLVAAQIAASIANAQAYEEERKRTQALAELDRAKTTFFSNVSHEFRTPLTLMLGPIDDILAKPADQVTPDNRELLTIVHRNGRRLLKLVNSLLDFSRIEAGRVRAVFQPVDLAAFTAELASVFRAATENAGLRLVIDCPPLPESAYVDRDMWEKIVLNLVSNAFKYTLAGRITVSLRADETAGHRSVLLSVEDTGIGIPEDELPRIFDRFHRVEGARGRTQEGTGIGLALAMELVKLHGGVLGVESVAGRGSTFRVRLPLGKDHLPADRIDGGKTLASTAIGADAFVEEALRWLPDAGSVPAQPLPSPTAEEETARLPDVMDHGRPTVVLADDNMDMREYVYRLLSADYNVIAVADGRQALRAVLERPPDLVLTDVMMPNLDGFGLLGAMRADPRVASIPVILLSARAGEEARVEGLQAGADDYLIKPFSARELLARVAGTLALARLRRLAFQREEELKAETSNILESITEGFIELDGGYNFTYVNSAARNIFRMGWDDLVGSDFRLLFPEAVGTDLESGLGRAMEQRVPTNLVYHHMASDRWYEINAYPAKHGGLAVYFRDITERRRSDEVQAGYARIATLRFDMAMALASGDGLAAVLQRSATLLVEHLDMAFARIWLIDREPAMLELRASAGIYTDLDGAHGRVPVGRFKIGRIAESRLPHLTNDMGNDPEIGDPEWAAREGMVGFAGYPLVVDGHVVGVIAMFSRQPIADAVFSELAPLSDGLAQYIERKRAEEGLRDTQRRLDAALAAGAIGTFRWDMVGNGLEWDENLDRVFGLPPGETARSLEEFIALVHPADRPEVLAQCERCMRDGADFDMYFRIVWPDGTERWIADRGKTVLDDAGRPSFMAGACIDITERKRAEEALTEADRRKDEFLATLAHELRNPLAPLRSGLEVMNLMGSDDPTVEEVRQMMERQLGQMVRLIDDLMDMSRISRNRIELRRGPVDIAGIVHDAVETSRPLIEGAAHTLRLELPAGPVMVDADATRLSQVFSNLLNNAAKYTEPGGHISLSVGPDGDTVVVAVEDDGVGIPGEMLPGIFEMFTQVDQSLEKARGGLGIGLTIVRRLVEMHGGTVEARSAGVGHGSRFMVRLPMLALHAGDAPAGTDGDSVTATRHRRILVVDDNRDSALSMTMLLGMMNNEVRSAHDGREALRLGAAFLPDMVLLDIGMPGMNGYEVARRIREESWGRNVVLVAVTGWGQPEDRRRSREAGFDHHLLKPVEPAMLTKLLTEVSADL
ncbi:MAG: domain S-box [Chlorobi bacterium]|nr:domain S-box [Chlorobiota bacterium]